MDENGYPTEEELERIRTWPWQDFVGLLEFVNAQCWWPRPDCGFRKFDDLYELATGGWSGNEEVIDALHHNPMFNALCWQSSHRGGLHVYKLPKLSNDEVEIQTTR